MGVRGLNPSDVSIVMGCTKCDWHYPLGLHPGLPVRSMPRDCPHCNEPVHVLEIIQVSAGTHTSKKREVPEPMFGIGVKTLTKNDVSWLAPSSDSHQDAINLPLKDFDDMFSDVRSDEPHRFPFEVHWHYFDGSNFAKTSCDVVYYETKNELRIVINKDSAGAYSRLAQEGTILVIKRREYDLEIFAIKPPSDIRTPEPLHGVTPKKSGATVPGIANRISPYLVCLKAASDAIISSGDEQVSIEYDELYRWVINYARGCRHIMRTRELKEGVPRGRRISSGFPVSVDEFMDKEQDKPRNRRPMNPHDEAEASESRWASTYLGYRTKDGKLKGGLFELGMLDQVQGRIGLTVLGREVVTECMLPGLESEEMGVRILDPFDAASFLLHLETHMPAEDSFILEYAGLLEKGALENQELVERLCRKEEARVRGGGDARWTDRRGVSWVDRDLGKLPQKIKPYLSGLQGRLWEMGFIEKDTSESRAKYYLTPDGEQEILT